MSSSVRYTKRPEGLPAYRWVADALKAQILEGGESFRLPPELELAKQYGLSRHTIRRAYQELVTQGLVTRTRGRGTFSARPRTGAVWLFSFSTIEEMTSPAHDTDFEILDPMRPTHDPLMAEELGLHFDEVWTAAVCRRRGDETLMLSHIVVPPDIAKGLKKRGHLQTRGRFGPGRSSVKFVQDVHHLPIVGAQQRITAIRAEKRHATALGCPVDSPLLRVEHTYFDSDGRPIQYASSEFDSNSYEWTMRLKQVAS